jgi:hypothetical protein
LHGPVHRARRLRGDDVRLAGGVVPNLGVYPSPEVQRERDLERDHDQKEAVGEGQEQPEPQAHSSSGKVNRKPTPRTVWRNRG